MLLRLKILSCPQINTVMCISMARPTRSNSARIYVIQRNARDPPSLRRERDYPYDGGEHSNWNMQRSNHGLSSIFVMEDNGDLTFLQPKELKYRLFLSFESYAKTKLGCGVAAKHRDWPKDPKEVERIAMPRKPRTPHQNTLFLNWASNDRLIGANQRILTEIFDQLYD